MSAASSILPLVWLVFSLVLGGGQVLAAIMLLKERHAGPWLMLGGALITLLGHGGTQCLVFLANLRGWFGSSRFGIEFPTLITAISSLGAFGSLLFTVGLLLFAFHRRGLAARIAELEQVTRTPSSTGKHHES